MINADEQIFISALNYLRYNRNISENEMREHFGTDGVFVLNVFWARFSDARKQKDGISTKDKRENVINRMEEEFRNGELKNSVKDMEHREKYLNFFMICVSVIATLCIFIFGGALLMLIPPIWIIVILLLWIIKKK